MQHHLIDLKRGLMWLANLTAVALGVEAPLRSAVAEAAWPLDHRFAPPQWQTAICLPDDWQKTLVGKDGALLYDYPGKFAGFGTRISFGLEGPSTWSTQTLVAPRVPVVRTAKRAGAVEIIEQAFSLPPSKGPSQVTRPRRLSIERVGSPTGQAGWAKPPPNTDPAFANVAIGWNGPVQYRFKAAAGQRFSVVFGLCEGWHTNAGQRVLELQVEGQTVRTVDLVAEKGRNLPALFAFPAWDQNGDGAVDLAVRAAPTAKDKNTILNVLWVFPEGQLPSLDQLLTGSEPNGTLAHVDCGVDRSPLPKPPTRHDVLLVTLRNSGDVSAEVRPTLTIESAAAMSPALDARSMSVGEQTVVFLPGAYQTADRSETKCVMHLAPMRLGPGQEQKLVFVVGRGTLPRRVVGTVPEAEAALNSTVRYWQGLGLPYGRIRVPDPAVQAQIDAAIRNIYQAREIKQDLPAFQVGPTCYRGLWVVDGAFLLEAITYLGRANEARAGIRYLLSFQRPDGGIMLIDGHWKETGIALWAVTRHARLTGDQAWLRQLWTKVEAAVSYIAQLRQRPPKGAPNEGLIPDGFSDGGLADMVPEYTNIYWTLVGLKAAVEAARWLGLEAQANAWQREFDDFYATFRRAAQRDMKTDAQGHRYLPIRMARGEGIPPQKAQWAFLHAIFPGKLFAADDPLVQGNMAMLQSVECQGLVQDTGWLKNGLWTYFGSFYAHAWLWLGQGQKAARTLYAFANHASPLLCWREEQMPVGQGDGMVGDMPHNWASAEFIRLVRHCLVLERGSELHLFEGLPPVWIKPGAVIQLDNIATEFGPVSLRLEVASDSRTARLTFSPPRRHPAQKIVLHLDGWSGHTGRVELPTRGLVRRTLRLSPEASESRLGATTGVGLKTGW
jgi:hypothetical protein